MNDDEDGKADDGSVAAGRKRQKKKHLDPMQLQLKN